MAMKLNFVMNLPPRVKRRAIQLSQQLAGKNVSYFVLGNQNHPHITVYAADFSENMVDQVIATAETVLDGLEPLDCTCQQMEAHQGYIGIELNRSDKIMAFHARVLQLLSPLYQPTNSHEEDYGMNLTPAQLANAQRYGYADALELYNPHLTITRLQDQRRADEVVQSKIVWGISEFTVSSFGLYTMGSHGTCKKSLWEQSIK